MNYLSDRQSFVLFQGQKSKLGKIKHEVPQVGSLPSTTTHYISKLPQPPE